MNKTIKRNVVISAILAIMLCVSLIAGATFALFTSESKVNIAVTSGKVDVKASIENFKASHPVSISTETNEPSENYLNGFYGGSANYNAETNEITLANMVAGDKVTFDLVITNYSTVPVKFKTTYNATGDQELIAALDISVGHSTGWVSLAAADKDGSVVNTLNCYIEMPCSANVQDKTCTLSFLVEAVQGNADVDEDNNIIYISNADEFVAFANAVTAGNSYAGKKVYLVSDIDLTGKDFKGIGNKHLSYASFSGMFDGQNHTIKGIEFANACPDDTDERDFPVGCGEYCLNSAIACCAAGLFNQTSDATIKNVVVDGAKITSAHYVGGIVGYISGKTTIENCEIVNSEITSKVLTVDDETDGGDKAGGIVGYMHPNSVVNNCSVSNTTITGYRDLGAIAGYANQNATVTNCTIGENVVVKVDRTYNYKNYTQASQYDAGNFVGESHATDDKTGNTGKATILNADYYIYTAADMFEMAANVAKTNYFYSQKTIQLAANIDLEDKAWTPVGTSAVPFAGTFDGNGFTIKNLSVTEADNVNKYDGVGLFGWVGIQGGAFGYVKNVTIDGATVSGHRYVGAVVGYLQFGSVENCTVKNAKITCTHKDSDRCGDKAGAVIGMVASNAENAKVSNCHAEDCTVKAARDAGQVIGMAYTSQKYISNLTATNVTVSAVENSPCVDDDNKPNAGTNINNTVVGREA